MKSIFILLIGFISGALIALFFAPESGDALRAQLGSEASTERQKLDAAIHHSLTKIQDRVDAVHSDLTGYMQEKRSDDDTSDADPTESGDKS